jgi:hypothetical protein
MLKNNIVIESFSMKNFIQIVVIIILAVLLLNQCRISADEKKVSKNNIEAYNDTVSYYQNKLGLEVAEKQSFKGTAAQLAIYFEAEKAKNKQLLESVRKFKKLENAATVNQTIQIDSVDIPFNIPVPFEFSRSFSKHTEFYSFAGVTNQFGHTINFMAKNAQTSVTGVKSIGWLSSEYRTEITNSNPHIKTKDFQKFNFIKKEKRFGIGFSVGFGFHYKGFFVGPSVNYSIIKF